MKTTIIILFTFLSFHLVAQKSCGNIFMTNNYDEISLYKKNILEDIKSAQIAENKLRITNEKDTILIPVVFNILFEDSIADAKLLDKKIYYEAVDSVNKYLNIEFSKLLQFNRAEFHDIVDVPFIKLVIARHNPQGAKSEGIRYKKWIAPDSKEFCEFPWLTGQQKAKLDQFGGISAWDNRHFFNMWIGNFRKTSGSCYGGQSTYPTFPFLYGQPLSFMDGVLLQDYIFKNNNHKLLSYFSTLIHELGHYLGLLHVWGGLADNNEKGCNIDDGIKDTPLQYEASSNCSTIKNSCIETINDKNDMCSNTMDYADGITFTIEQVKVMRNAAQNIRKDLSIPKVEANLEISKTQICDGELVTLKWISTAAKKSDFLYTSWSNQANILTHTLQPTNDTTFNIYLTNAYDTIFRTVTISVSKKPTAQFSIPDTVYQTQNFEIILGNATTVQADISHTFSNATFAFQADATTDSFYIYFQNNCFKDTILIQYIFKDLSTNINNKYKSNLKIYPNPTTNTLNLDIEKSKINLRDTYTIINANGQLYKLGNLSNQIDISDLQSGSYFLVFTYTNKSFAIQFLKE